MMLLRILIARCSLMEAGELQRRGLVHFSVKGRWLHRITIDRKHGPYPFALDFAVILPLEGSVWPFLRIDVKMKLPSLQFAGQDFESTACPPTRWCAATVRRLKT